MRVIYLSLFVAVANAFPKSTFFPLRDVAQSPRIMHGLLAEDGQFPWQVTNLFSRGQGRYFCGGSLISEGWVLTAAHCAVNAYDVEITLGTTYSDHSDENEVVSYQNEAIPHELFDFIQPVNDVALIRLGQLVIFTDKIQPIKMADSFIDADVPVIAIGWGRTENGLRAVTNLYYVHLITVTNEFCREKYLPVSIDIVDEVLCCVGADQESTCSGDSGGPLVQQQSDGSYVHVGVVSFVGSDACDNQFPTGYLRTASYRDWIYNQAGI